MRESTVKFSGQKMAILLESDKLIVSVLNYRDARLKALHLLNTKKPQFPPDVYYIRRNPDVLKTFLNDKDHITNLQKD